MRQISNRLSRSPLSGSSWYAVEYDPESDEVVMLDQKELPNRILYHRYRKPDEVAGAIRNMGIPGAPALGMAAAFALVLLSRHESGSGSTFLLAHGAAGRFLNQTRPTAINLSWAI